MASKLAKETIARRSKSALRTRKIRRNSKLAQQSVANTKQVSTATVSHGVILRPQLLLPAPFNPVWWEQMRAGRVDRLFRQHQRTFHSPLTLTVADCRSMLSYQQIMMREAQVAAVTGTRPQLSVAPVQARQSSRIKIESPSVNADKKTTNNAGTVAGDSLQTPSTPTDSGDEKPCSNGISVHIEADLSPSKSKL